MSIPINGEGEHFEVFVAKEYLKFSAAHFIAYRGFREPLHGHNYQVSVRIRGTVGEDGYVLDFGLVKKAAKAICEELDERVLLPRNSDCITFAEDGPNVTAVYEDGSRFSFPRVDTISLPIIHTSAEELAQYLAFRIRDRLSELARRDTEWMEVGVGEAPGQFAYARIRLNRSTAPA